MRGGGETDLNHELSKTDVDRLTETFWRDGVPHAGTVAGNMSTTINESVASVAGDIQLSVLPPPIRSVPTDRVVAIGHVKAWASCLI